MENARRDKEQSGHRGLGISVHARERVNDEPLSMEQSLEAQNSSSLMSNPLLDSQRFDGIDLMLIRHLHSIQMLVPNMII